MKKNDMPSKPIKKKEWRPKEVELWYCFDWDGTVVRGCDDYQDSYTRFQWRAINFGNAFKTRSAAIRAAREIKKLLKKLPKE